MDSIVDAGDNFTFNMDETEATSPSQLEEVTLDPESSMYSVGLRSPILGSRGRSIKEFEEQLSGLRKENFNLKLRIYFLEERMGNNFNLDEEDAVKKNIELMVELESLRKEVQEKQDLLCQAVKAMELEEDEHRKENDCKDKELKDVKLHLDTIQRQYDVLQEEVRSQVDLTERDYFSSAMNMQEDSQEIIAHLENRIADLEAQLRIEQQTSNKANATVTAVDQLQSKINEKEDKLREALLELDEKCNMMVELQSKMETMEVEMEGKQNEISVLKRKLDQKATECKDLQVSMSEIKNLNEECNTMYANECKRNERHRLAITNRNAKINELENSIEKYKTQVANLEMKLETAVNEVKSKTNESPPPSAMSSPRLKTQFTDGPSISVRSTSPHADYSPASKSLINKSQRLQSSPNFKSHHKNPSANKLNASGDEALESFYRNMSSEELREELVKFKKHVSKLEQDQLKACRIIQTMLETRKKNGKEIEELQRGLQHRDALINDMRMKVNDDASTKSNSDKKSIQERVSELNLTAAAPSSDTERSIMDDEHDPHLLLEQYKQLANDLETQKQILVDTLKEKDSQTEELEAKYEEIYKDLKDKENRIIDLEFEILSANDNDSTSSTREKADSGTEKASFWIKESEEKDKEIEKLEKELAQRTHDLQGVVNNELWQKNREIERLQKYVTGADKKDMEIADLKKQINDHENKLKVYSMRVMDYEEAKKRERNAIQEKLNTSNEDRNELLIEINDLNHQIDALTKDAQNVKDELRLSDELRVETQQVCSVLGKRLEEMALFLDSLLKQKSVLGFLGYKQNKVIRQRVEQSLDLSKSLSITLQMNPDQSLLQLSNISEILNTTNRNESLLNSIDLTHSDADLCIMPDNITLTYQSHLNMKNLQVKDDQSEVIRVLRAQIDNLKGEIELRDNELAQRMSLNSLRQNELMEQLAEISCTPQTPLSTEEILQQLKLHNEKKKQQHVDNNSDSESWSEPDRSVSKARIGLDDKALKPKVKMVDESTEVDNGQRVVVSRTPSKKSIGISESRGLISQLNDQVVQFEQLVRDKDDLLSKAALKNQELETRYTDIYVKYEAICLKCNNLEMRVHDINKEYKDLDNMYQSLQCSYTNEKDKYEEVKQDRDALQQTVKILEDKLRSALDCKMTAENEIVLLSGKIENLETYKTMLTDSMDTKTKFIQNRLNELEVEKGQAQKETKAAEGKLEDAMKEIGRITDKLLSLEINHAKSTATLINEAEKEVDRRVREAEREFNEKVDIIDRNAQEEVYRIQEAAETIAQKYESDYVEKSEMERLQSMIKDLESVQDVLKLSEQKVKQLEVSENSLKQQLFESDCTYRNKLNDLRIDLDASTLHCSQLQLEKTRAEEEKTQLQVQMKQFTEREEVFERQVADLKNEFSQLKDNFKRQLASIETEKSHLDVKISSLESLNADLQNQIVRFQCSREFNNKAHSAPTTPNGRILDLYLSKNQFYNKQFSEVNTNYANDAFANFHKDNVNVDHEEVERMQANSSPDLGIESDQGRFSSLEAQMVSLRPLAPSIDLTATMSEQMGRHQRDVALNNCNNDKCVTVVKEMHSENYLLKKKLQKSNRLLEETLSQLAKANQRKREVEKNICKQIHKTSQVLKIAKANLDSGSDTELTRK